MKSAFCLIRYTLKYYSIICFLGLAFYPKLIAQTLKDVSVQVNATVQRSPAKISLKWVANANSQSYEIFRKLKTANSWGTVLASLPGTSFSFEDVNVSTEIAYEYKIVRNGANFKGYGYILSGIEIPEVETRGKVILLIDSLLTDSLTFEIERFQNDLEGDGWVIIKRTVMRSQSVSAIRDIVKSAYTTDPLRTRALLILGHVPVPYSGNISPDGHNAHKGAWATDMFYGELTSSWTDNTVNVHPFWNTQPPTANLPTTNEPGDGKFDQSTIPSDMELEVGRIDLFDLPAFGLTETELTRQYLNKNHAFRTKEFSASKIAVIDDNFGYLSGWAPAAIGFKNFGPLVGSDSISTGDYFTSLNSNSYLWSYGCGGGSWDAASGIGNTANFNDNTKGVFTMLFGSFFGDFDITNNFLRAPLGTGKILTNVWAGNPHWQFHQMGLGETIGYSVKATQNNVGSTYYQGGGGYTGRSVHNNLMGDPTLRQDIVEPVFYMDAERIGDSCKISWVPPFNQPDVIGYHIYVLTHDTSQYIRLNDQPILGVSYVHNSIAEASLHTYMVKSVVLQTTPSGSYYNLSLGITDTVSFDNPTSNQNIYSNYKIRNIKIYPNPSCNVIRLDGLREDAEFLMYSSTGKLIFRQLLKSNSPVVDVSDFKEGLYFIHIKGQNWNYPLEKFLKIK